MDTSWDVKLAEFGKKVLRRRFDPQGNVSLSSRRVISDAEIGDITSFKTCIWLSEFRCLDPRWRILNYFSEMAQLGAQDVSTMSLNSVLPLPWFMTRSSIFTVWRPTVFDAVRKTMLGKANLQIGTNQHKGMVRTMHKQTVVRIFSKLIIPCSRRGHGLSGVSCRRDDDAVSKTKAILDGVDADPGKETMSFNSDRSISEHSLVIIRRNRNKL
jgi:hypothetical protein